MSQITIKDVAAKCGVGVSTVSRAINNHPDINTETKQMIMDVIQESGYIPNNSARNLKRSDTKSIAVLVKGITNTFFGKMIKVIDEETKKKRYSVELRHVEFSEDEVDVALELVKEKRLKGIIFLGGYFRHSHDKLEKLGVPFIFVTVSASPEKLNKSAYSDVVVDDYKESKKVTEYLIELGHKDIAILAAGAGDFSSGKIRLDGYLAALNENGLPVKEELINRISGGSDTYSMERGYEATKQFIESGAKFTAIYAITDNLAIGALRALSDFGLKVPEDVSVIGFDGIDLGEYTVPRLTTLKQPVEEMAKDTVKLLFRIIAGKEKHQHIVYSGELIKRESVAELKK